MVKLRIGNSVCQILGLDQDRFRELRESISVREKTGRMIPTSTGKRIPEIRTQYLIDKRGEFPTGLLYLVKEFLAESGEDWTIDDTRVVPRLRQFWRESMFLPGLEFTPRPEQVEAAVAALEHGRGIVVGPTGVGKSAIAAQICDAFQVPTLIVVPSLELKRQTIEGLRQYFGEDVVGPLRRDGVRQYFVTVENVDALDPKKPMKGIDCVIIDEFHHSGAKTYRTLNRKAWEHVYFKIGLTATPFRSNDEERLYLESVLSHVIYRIEYATAVAKQYIVPMEVYYYDLPERKLKRGGQNYHSVYKQLVVEREDRNQLIADLVEKLWGAGASTLILVKQIEHGLLLQREIDGRGYIIPFVKGENEDNREVISRFSSGEAGLLIGTTGVIGEGVDTKAAEWVILAGGGKSKNAFMQQVGRGFRNFPGKETCKVIMFRDPSNKWLLEHFNACVRYLREEYGVEPVRLE
jgi:superfamily II DNA or RNA helicase